MDALHFDILTRHLSAGLTRRRSLSHLVSLGLLGLVVPEATEARKKPCPPCKKRKKGKCKKKKPDGTVCPGGTCQSGSCVAATSTPPPGGCPGRRVCGSTCCPEGQVCGSNGACVHPSCCGGDVTCGPHTTAGRVCCVAPRQARCCCDTSKGAGNGYVICCAGNECPVGCASGALAFGFPSGPPNADGVCVAGLDVTQPNCPA
jgi:hypothetical protein